MKIVVALGAIAIVLSLLVTGLIDMLWSKEDSGESRPADEQK